MAEKTGKKIVAISIKRERIGLPKVVVATGFKLRIEKATGLIDILLDCYGQKGERVTMDPVLVNGSLDALKQYAAGLTAEPDDTAEREDVMVGEMGSFANVAHFSHMGGRAETVFGVFCVADWAEASRRPQGGTPEILSVDVVVAMSTTAFQKKLLLDLVLLVSQRGKE